MRDAWQQLGRYLGQLDTPAAPRIADTGTANDSDPLALVEAA
jgi:hypothetical protein